MNSFVHLLAILGILGSRLCQARTYNFFKHDEELGKMELYDHRGLKVYFFDPYHGADVDKVVIGNQGVWTKREGQNLSKVVGFFRCMGFGLSHVSYYTDQGEPKELLLSYNHSSGDLEEVDKTKFYEKLLSYTNDVDKSNPDIPGHQVLVELERMLEDRKNGRTKPRVEKAKEVAKEAAKEKKAEVPVTDKTHTEL